MLLPACALAFAALAQEPVVPQADEPQALAAFEAEVQRLYLDLVPSLVEVQARVRGGAEGPVRILFTAGLVLDDAGLLVSPVFVPPGARPEELPSFSVVRADGERFPARLLDYDDSLRLGLLRADGLVGMAPELARSSELEPGALVVALGNAHGLFGSLSVGFLVDGFRWVGGRGPLIQTTVPVRPGDAGGLLADRRGRVVGLLTRPTDDASEPAAGSEYGGPHHPGLEATALAGEGIGFAVPIEFVLATFSEHCGDVRFGRRFLGVEVRHRLEVDQWRGEPRRRWVLAVRRVVPGSPAHRAGIRRGDVVVRVDDRPVSSLADLSCALAECGAESRVVVDRDGLLLEFTVVFDDAFATRAHRRPRDGSIPLEEAEALEHEDSWVGRPAEDEEETGDDGG